MPARGRAELNATQRRRPISRARRTNAHRARRAFHPTRDPNEGHR
ncbi:hypothetical protein BURMUCF2_B0075 [Burkholderia multivorans CF2]|nr:hypothetical protein BURMUCF2_B0075 [Burkholderia multivorans CF2]